MLNARSLCVAGDVAPLPHGQWQTHTVIAALRPDALTVPGVFDGPIDSTRFVAYVEQVLVPTLQLAMSWSSTTCRA